MEIGSSSIIQEPDEEVVKSWEKEFDTWNDWWLKFITDFEDNWVRFHPIYIHESVRPFIRKAFNNHFMAKASNGKKHVEMPNEYTLSHWLMLLNEK